MKLERAQQILEDYVGTGPEVEPVEFDKAVALGVEALREVKKARYGDPALDGELLPGED